MTRAALAAACVLITLGCYAQNSEAVSVESPVARQEEDVRQFIEFDRVAASIDANAGVAAVWPDVRQFLPPAGGWEVVRDEVTFTDIQGLMERLVILRSGEAQLTIDIFVSSRGPRPALDQLVDTMVATSIGYRKFQKGPADLGQVSFVLPVTNPTLLFVNRNVFVRLRRDNHSIDLVPVAKALSAFMEANVAPKLAARLPVLAATSVTPETPAVNASARLALQLPAGIEPAAVMWTLAPEVDRDVVDTRDQGADYLEFRVTRPGKVAMPVWVADRRTLLSSAAPVNVEAR
jgi:hypothetical protein